MANLKIKVDKLFQSCLYHQLSTIIFSFA